MTLPISLRRLALACALVYATSAHAGSTLIEHVRVFDGSAMHADRTVFIDHGKIVDANFHGAAPAGAQRVDGTGRTLLPGLIDAHVHAFRFFELAPLFGVSTEIDMFTSVAVMQDVSRKMREGRNQGQADLFSAGTLVTVPGGHGTEYGMDIPTLTKPEDAQAFVDARLAEGSAFIKIVMERGWPGHPMPTLDLATVKATIAAAHKRHKLAVVHIGNIDDARAALEAGADGLVHLFVGKPVDAAAMASFVALAKARHAFIIPTFSVLESMAGVPAADVLGNPQLAGLLNKEQIAILKASYSPVPRPDLLQAPRALVAALHQAGVPILAGTDAGNTGTMYGASLHHELQALVQAGLTPTAALAAATSVSARTFGLSDRGRIANGLKADLLLVDGDPGTDISASTHIVEVWKDGEPVGAARASQQAAVAAELARQPSLTLALPPDGRISQFSKDKLASPIGMGWIASSDSFMGGKSSVTLDWQDGEAPGGTLDVHAKVVPGFAFPWAGLAFVPGKAPMQPADLSAAKVLKFRVRGDGQRYSVAMMAQGLSIPVSQSFAAGAQWQEVTLPMASFKGIDLAQVTMISFNAGPAVGEYRFQIADIRLLGDQP